MSHASIAGANSMTKFPGRLACLESTDFGVPDAVLPILPPRPPFNLHHRTI